MSLEKINLRNSILILMVIAAASTRLLGLGGSATWMNFSPLGAIALFSGAYFTSKLKAYMVPLVTLLLSDVMMSYFYFNKFLLFYEGAFYVYLAFAIMVAIGTLMHKINVGNVFLASVASVLVHWLLSDIQPWLAGYPHTLSGYVQCLIAAIPFEKNLLFGNLLFGTILFGGFELAKSKFSALRNTKELAY